MKYYNSQISYVIDEIVHSERDRKVLKRRYMDNISYPSLEDEFRLTERQLKRIVKKYDAELWSTVRKLHDNGTFKTF